MSCGRFVLKYGKIDVKIKKRQKVSMCCLLSPLVQVLSSQAVDLFFGVIYLAAAILWPFVAMLFLHYWVPK